MIISTSHRFIFVHIPKTAGMAVTDALGPFGREKKRTLLRSISRRLPFREKPEAAHFRVHDPARLMIKKLGRDVFDSFTTFSVVRNPYDHAVSHFEYMKQFRIKKTADKVAGMTFEEYLRYRQNAPFWNDTIFARMPAQSWYLTDERGELAVDRLIRFESLNDDLIQLAEDLSMEGVVLRHINKTKSKSKKKPMEAYYSDATLELVRQIYKPDFELLGYDREFRPAAKG